MLAMMNRAAKLSDLEDANSSEDLSIEEDAERAINAKTDTFHMQDGTTHQVTFADQNFKAEYRDEYTGEILPRHLVREAMVNELTYFNEHVWRGKDATAAKQDHLNPIRTRWVICNKGDAENPEVRARLVACEINDYTDASGLFYAATRPQRPGG